MAGEEPLPKRLKRSKKASVEKKRLLQSILEKEPLELVLKAIEQEECREESTSRGPLQKKGSILDDVSMAYQGREKGGPSPFLSRELKRNF